MPSSDPIAYTYEAAEHCPACTAARFGTEEGYPWPPESATDREGNGIGAIAPWDELFGTVACDDCGTILYEGPEEENV